MTAAGFTRNISGVVDATEQISASAHRTSRKTTWRRSLQNRMSYFDQTAALFRFLRQNRKVRGARHPRLLKAIGTVPEQYPDPGDE